PGCCPANRCTSAWANRSTCPTWPDPTRRGPRWSRRRNGSCPRSLPNWRRSAAPHRARLDRMTLSLRQLADRLTLEQKVRLLTGQAFWSLPAEPAIGLRSVVVSDGPAGVRGSTWSELEPSASFPSPTALAASWDTERAYAVGALLAAEARRKGV